MDNPVGDDGRFFPSVPLVGGMSVWEANPIVIDALVRKKIETQKRTEGVEADGRPRDLVLTYAGLVILAVGALVMGWTRLPITLFYREGRPTRFGKLTNRTMGRPRTGSHLTASRAA